MTDLSFTYRERIVAGIALAIYVAALLNWAVWSQSVVGLSGKQVAIILTLPMAFLFLLIVERSKARDRA